MAKHLLTLAKIQLAKLKAKPGRRSDGDGLYLLSHINSRFAPAWRFDYTFKDRRKTLSLGRLERVSLEQARKSAEEHRSFVAKGVDPSVARQEQRRIASSDITVGKPTFEQVAREWLETKHRPEVSESHADRTLARFENYVFAKRDSKPAGPIDPLRVGALPIDLITRPMLVELLKQVQKSRDVGETAHRTAYAASQVFEDAILKGLCQHNPAKGVTKGLVSKPSVHMPALTDPAEVRELMLAIDGYTGQLVTKAALRLAPLLFQRPGNLRQMEWREVDLEAATWTIPSAKMKRSIEEKINGSRTSCRSRDKLSRSCEGCGRRPAIVQ